MLLPGRQSRSSGLYKDGQVLLHPHIHPSVPTGRWGNPTLSISGTNKNRVWDYVLKRSYTPTSQRYSKYQMSNPLNLIFITLALSTCFSPVVNSELFTLGTLDDITDKSTLLWREGQHWFPVCSVRYLLCLVKMRQTVADIHPLWNSR